MIKQVLVLRTDLNMRKGKMAAQAAHASMKVFLDRARREVEVCPQCGSASIGVRIVGSETQVWSCRECTVSFGAPEHKHPDHLFLKLTPEMQEWIFGIFTKIVVGIDNEKDLLGLYLVAKQAGLPCAMVEDCGATEFHGQKTLTCIAIGPAKAEDIDPHTKHLKLL